MEENNKKFSAMDVISMVVLIILALMQPLSILEGLVSGDTTKTLASGVILALSIYGIVWLFKKRKGQEEGVNEEGADKGGRSIMQILIYIMVGLFLLGAVSTILLVL